MVKKTKKVTKKHIKYKKNKKGTKRRKNKKLVINDVYAVINKAQITNQKTMFETFSIEADTVENIIKDIPMEYERIQLKTKTVFWIYPKDNSFDKLSSLEVEYIDDEIPEDGQIF